jgi:DNA-binding NarL/FixJ family response regulator
METHPQERIRIVIADDHPVVRDGLVAMLSTQEDFQVAGEAATGRETIARTLELRPSVLLLDLEMPDMDGVQALEEIRRAFPEIQAIVLTAFDTDERILNALKSGARGYLLKGSPRQEIFHAIRTVSQGGSLLQPVVTTRLLEHIRSTEEGREPFSPLTGREREILQRVARGNSNKQIALALSISERTVKFHVSAILRKLNAANRAEAVQKALTSSLIEL